MSTPPSGSHPDQQPGGPGAGPGPPPPGSPPPVPPSPPPPPGGYGGPQQRWGGPPGDGYGSAPVRDHAPGAVASLVCGILGLFTIPLVLSIIAVVLGNQSKRAAEAEPDRYNDQFGQVGRILGWIGIGLAALGLLFFVAVLVFLMPLGAWTLRV